MYATQGGHMDVLKYLVEMPGDNIDLAIRDRDGRTCAMHAALFGNLDVLVYLVDVKGAKIDHEIKDTYGMTCAMHAANYASRLLFSGEDKRLNVLKYLVEEKGVRIDGITDKKGFTALDYAINEEVKAYLRSVLAKQSSCGACNP